MCFRKKGVSIPEKINSEIARLKIELSEINKKIFMSRSDAAKEEIIDAKNDIIYDIEKLEKELDDYKHNHLRRKILEMKKRPSMFENAYNKLVSLLNY